MVYIILFRNSKVYIAITTGTAVKPNTVYSGKFSRGAKFRDFPDRSASAKIKTAKNAASASAISIAPRLPVRENFFWCPHRRFRKILHPRKFPAIRHGTCTKSRQQPRTERPSLLVTHAQKTTRRVYGSARKQSLGLVGHASLT